MPNHNFIDLTGQTFSWVFIESRAENNSDGRAMWNCLCLKCGTRFVANGKNLRLGKTRSCGCYRREYAHERAFEDLTGQTFNSLYVESFCRQNKWRESMWDCRCLLCNNHSVVSTKDLKSGHIKTCGCTRRESIFKACAYDLNGRKCGLLMPKYIVGRNKNNNVLWHCDCECGGSIITTAHMLVSGRVLSCGCLVSKNENRIKLWLEENNIDYERQKMFDGCRNVKKLMFDFYIPSQNTVIEYDGEFHYMNVTGLNNDLEYQQQNDKIKNQYCHENGIKMIRIPYWEQDNIETILSECLFV